MLLFLIQQEIDYSTAQNLVHDPDSVAGGSRGATSTNCLVTHGSVGAPFMNTYEGNLLLTTSMIVDMGGRPLKSPNGLDQSVLSQREKLMASLEQVLRESGQD